MKIQKTIKFALSITPMIGAAFAVMLIRIVFKWLDLYIPVYAQFVCGIVFWIYFELKSALVIGKNNSWTSVKDALPSNLEYDWVIVKLKEYGTDYPCVPRVAERRGNYFYPINDDINNQAFGIEDIKYESSIKQNRYVNMYVTHWKPIE